MLTNPTATPQLARVFNGSDINMTDDRFETIFKALANEQRLKIVYLLLFVDNRVTVSEFAFVFEDSQSNASRQLKILKEAGLLEKQRDGRNTFYSIVSERDLFLNGVLESLAGIPRAFVQREIDRCNYLVEVRDTELSPNREAE